MNDEIQVPGYDELLAIVHDPAALGRLLGLAETNLKHSDEWLHFALVALRLSGQEQRALMLVNEYKQRVRESVKLSHEAAILFAMCCSPEESMGWLVSSIAKWPQDEYLWALFLDCHAVYLGSAPSVGANQDDLDGISEVANHGVRGLLYHSIGRDETAADILRLGHEANAWDPYLCMLALKSSFLFDIAPSRFQVAIRGIEKYNTNGMLFMAVLSFRLDRRAVCKLFLESISPSEIEYWTDRLLAVIIAEKVGPVKNRSRIVSAFMQGGRTTKFGLDICNRIL